MEILKIMFNYKNYSGEIEKVEEEIREDNLARLKNYAKTNDRYSNIIILENLGKENREHIKNWFEIGKKNPFICKAEDPKFTEDSFTECKTLDYLIEIFKHCNWCIGQAFYYKNLCFINQVNAGDEWLTIRDGVHFESASCGAMIKYDGEEYFKLWIEDCLTASVEELKHLDYAKKSTKYRDSHLK